MIQRHIKNNLESFVISALLWKANKKTKLRNYKVVLGLQNSRTICEHASDAGGIVSTKGLERVKEQRGRRPREAGERPYERPNAAQIKFWLFYLFVFFFILTFNLF